MLRHNLKNEKKITYIIIRIVIITRMVPETTIYKVFRPEVKYLLSSVALSSIKLHTYAILR